MCGRVPSWANITENREFVTCKICIKAMYATPESRKDQ